MGDLQQDAKGLGVSGSFVTQGSFALAAALGVHSTDDVFLMDARHRLCFRGAVHDHNGLGYTRDKATRHYLRHALEALIE